MALYVEGLSKAYNKNQIIDQFTCQIEGGEIVILLGKSGTGKTTFMRLINNLEKADQGSIRINVQYLCQASEGGARYLSKADQRAYQNNLGMVFQDFQLFPNFTVLENLMEAPLAQKLASPEAIQAQALDLLAKVGLSDKAEVKPSTLSGGQKQRVAIARALMLNPDVICFDEPTSALDRESANQVGALIQELADSGQAVLIVTHDTEFGREYGTRIISSSDFK
ncbi:amino acid ABC transporter ATP-binding protein [Aerococcus sp. HMSC06H08]|uniref:amino acid ABC transporter ATP-binding protein n=1 Tax=Aerococcus sp. HMSC06H08 TaxID=1581129 RepID=UPI0008A55944|nr:ATP-binding cassette domain-containing protein [Aerococcus sp. HMSC06H08]OFT42385.1 polar amino acid ABC transporter ATP-binding protein [Aerococcus sp. HMSC06H08]